jgi:hypothetical protein
VLLEEMRNPQSRWAPYWASLPTFESGEISSLQSLPPAYLPLLGCNATVCGVGVCWCVCGGGGQMMAQQDGQRSYLACLWLWGFVDDWE